MEVKDGIELCQQMDFSLHSGIFRWGCFWMSLGAWVQLRMKKALTKKEILAVYDYSRTAKTWRNDHVLEMGQKNFQLNCNDPSRALQIWLEAVAQGQFKGWQSGDNEGFYTWVPEGGQRETFRLWRYTTMRGGGHWVLTDLKGRTVYNPAVDVELKEQSKYFRRFYVTEESV